MPENPPSTIPFFPTPQTQLPPESVPPTVTPDTPQTSFPIIDPGDMPAGPGVPIISEQAFGPNGYRESFMDSRYDWDYGIEESPVAGPAGTPAEIITVHAPICLRIVEWTLERLGLPPVAPSWISNNPNETLKSKMISPASPAMGSDGTLVYRRSGRYVYALRFAPADTDYLFTGQPSYMATSPNVFNVQQNDFSSALSDASSTTPAAYTP